MLRRELVECPVCEGEGGTYEDDYSHVHGHFTRDVACSRCGGQGEVREWVSDCNEESEDDEDEGDEDEGANDYDDDGSE